MEAKAPCLSIKSKKHPSIQCPSLATKGEFCSRHCKSKVKWAPPAKKPLTRKQSAAATTILNFWIRYGRLHIRRLKGQALFTPERSDNPKDIYSMESISTIPFTYHFSYIDAKKHLWTFDLRFLVQSMHYGNDMKNPFSQELLPPHILQRLQVYSERLRKRGVPILYVEKDVLTPEQIWNQKVLDVFLKLTAHGYCVNVLWFETLTVRGHELFYTRMYELWSSLLSAEKDRIVPGHGSGRNPLFRWTPSVIEMRSVGDLKWWRKQTLGMMNTFLSRGTDRATQGCGALYVLTALARTHPKVAEAYAWLAGD